MAETARRLLAADEDDALQALQRIEALLERLVSAVEAIGRRPAGDDERYVRLTEALAASMGDMDLAFSATEVLEHAAISHDLDLALKACGIKDTNAFGVLFRALRGRRFGVWKVIRDRRDWRLDRCT